MVGTMLLWRTHPITLEEEEAEGGIQSGVARGDGGDGPMGAPSVGDSVTIQVLNPAKITMVMAMKTVMMRTMAMMMLKSQLSCAPPDQIQMCPK